MIISGNSRTIWDGIFLGVPQGSVREPILFLLFTADITKLIPSQSARGHLFADDVQAYVQGPHSAQLIFAGRIQALCLDLHLWMTSNQLSLYSSKTHLVYN